MTDTLDTPFTFDYGDDQPDRRTAVFQALGAASACWENLSGAGTFESDQARAVGDALMDELARLDQPLLGLATTDQLLEELAARFRVARLVSTPVDDTEPSEVEAALGEVLEQVRIAGCGGYRTVDS